MNLKAVIFDWAGTVIDHGSRAPMATLLAVFEEAGVPITEHEARLSMGIAKRDHIASILAHPRVAEEWRKSRGEATADQDVSALYERFIPLQLSCLADHSELIHGVPECAAELRARGLKIGSTTGYTRPMLEYLLGRAAEQGFVPDCAVCPDDVPGGGRPAPWMCYSNAIQMRVAPLWCMVKIGDTPSDIEEGLAAGMWTIGIIRSGNEAGLSARAWEELASPTERERILERAVERLKQAGAHYLAETVADCPRLIDEIEARLDAGERP